MTLTSPLRQRFRMRVTSCLPSPLSLNPPRASAYPHVILCLPLSPVQPIDRFKTWEPRDLPSPDHAYQACATALDMLKALKSLRERWAAAGLPDIRIGIGINTATMVVGNMGSDMRFDYTVMGDGVNLASRLEGVNKEYRTTIVLSDSTWELVKDRIATRELDVIRVKGKAKPTRIFEALGLHPLAPAELTMVKLFEEGLQAYRAQQWETALHSFHLTLEQAPDDFPSQLYVQRCESFMGDPPPSDWDGVFSMKTK